MPAIHPGRFAAQIEGDFVVFLIGMRINRLLLVHKWLPVATAMPPMIKELMRQPALGLLHAQVAISGRTILNVQYWRSFEQLEAFARDPGDLHRPTWLNFYRRARDGRTGIWHESYLVRAGEYEAVYDDVPVGGLAAAGVPVALEDGRSARQRLRRTATP
jgi:hypothetical protein